MTQRTLPTEIKHMNVSICGSGSPKPEVALTTVVQETEDEGRNDERRATNY